MAQYDANINVNVNAKQAESQLTKLQQTLDKLSRASSNINVNSVERGLRNVGQTASKVGTEVKNIFSRGLFAGAILGAGQLGTSIAAATSHLGPFTGAVKAAGAAFSSSLGGAPALIGNILNQIGHIPNAMGLAAVAAMAFAPQLLKASSAAVGLGAAIDKAVGPKAVSGIAGFAEKLTSVEQQFKRIAAPMELLREELTQATREFDKYVAFTDESVAAAKQLLAVEKQVTAEKRAQNTLLTQLDPFAARRIGLQQRIARIRRGEEGGTAGFREFQSRQQRIAAESERSAYLQAYRAGRPRAEIPTGPLMLPAFQERGLRLLDNSVRLNESNLRIERALNGERARGARFLEKQTAEERRQVELGILGQRTNRLPGQRGAGFAFPTAGPVPLSMYGARPAARTGTAAGLRSSNFGGVLSNAIIGGAFPLLFGQGGGAATGGAIGGLVGGAFGGAGGFAGSLLGTLIGERMGRANQVKELAADIGFTAEQTQTLATAFQQAGANFDKFQESVQNIRGLNLSIEDQANAVRLVSQLTASYGGNIDKITNAFTGALETGKVTQATLNQLTSQGIPIQDALAQRYSVSRDKLLQMAKDGQISVQALIDTLVKVGNEGMASADKQRNAFEEGFDKIQEAAKYLQQSLTQSFKETSDSLRIDLGGAILAVTQYIADFIRGLGEVSRFGGTLLDPIISGYINLQKSIFSAASAVPGLTSAILSFVGTVFGPLSGAVALIDRIRGAGAASRGLRQGPPVPERLKQPALAGFKAPAQFVPAEKGGGRSKTDKAAEDAKKEAERVAEVVRSRLAEAEVIRIKSAIQDRIAAAEASGDKMLVVRLQGLQKEVELQYQYAQQIAKETNLRAQQAIIFEGQTALIANQRNTQRELIDLQRIADQERLNSLQKFVEKQYELNVAVQQQKDLADGLSTTLGEGLTSTFDLLITGTNDWGSSLQQIASNVLVDIANQLLRIFVIEQAINSIRTFLTPFNPSTPLGAGGGLLGRFGTFGPNYGIPQFANGGRPPVNRPSIVGERGPELFVPGASGTIIPNNMLGGMGGDVSVVVNVDASGSQVQGNEGQAKALGSAISAAVQAEIVKQKRPGGLLAGTR